MENFQVPDSLFPENANTVTFQVDNDGKIHLVPTPSKKSDEESKTDLQIINREGLLLVDSREVAEMTGVRHGDLLEKIDSYIQYLENGKIRSQDFFTKDSYIALGNKKPYKCYLLTRKGCDMVANKMTGQKGVLFTAAYVSKFEEMERIIREQGNPVMDLITKDPVIMIRFDQLQMKEQINSIEEKVQAIESRLEKQPEFSNNPQMQTSPLTDACRWYTSKEIVKMAKVSYQHVGRAAKKHNLQTEQYSKIRTHETGEGSNSISFRQIVYNEAGKDKLLAIMEQYRDQKKAYAKGKTEKTGGWKAVITFIKYTAARKKSGELETISREVVGKTIDDGSDPLTELARILAPSLKAKIEKFAQKKQSIS